MLIFLMLFIAGTINCAQQNHAIKGRTQLYATCIKNGTPFPDGSLWAEQILKPIAYIAALQKEQGDELITIEAQKLATHEATQPRLNPSLHYKLDMFPSNRSSYVLKNLATQATYMQLTDDMAFFKKPRPLHDAYQQTCKAEENNIPKKYRKVAGISFYRKSRTGNTYIFSTDEGQYLVAQKNARAP